MALCDILVKSAV